MGESTSPSNPAQALRRACEVVRPGLTRVVGRQGFAALLARSLALTKGEFVWLAAVEVDGEGTISGLDEATNGQDHEVAAQGCGAVFANLLQLLTAFIGPELALKFVKVGWPDAPFEEFGSETEEGGV